MYYRLRFAFLFICTMFFGMLSISWMISFDSIDRFLPENDLHLEDTYPKSGASEGVFNEILDRAQRVYSNTGEPVFIHRRWTDSTVNAYMQRKSNGLHITMFGGLFRRSEVTPEGFALVVCHEFGHGYGGAPYIYPHAEISAEGQADYYAANACLQHVLEGWWESQESLDLDLEGAESWCDSSTCEMGLRAGLSLGTLLATLGMEEVSVLTPDPYITPVTLKSYPKTAQCRLDTYVSGVLNAPRPRCWFAD